MARPRSTTPTYRFVLRGSRYSVQWRQNGRQNTVATGQPDEAAARAWFTRFLAEVNTPAAPAELTVGHVLDGYAADRRHIRGYASLETNIKALRRHLGALQPDQVNTQQSRFYRARRKAEGYEVGGPENRRRKPVQDGTIYRELCVLRAAMGWAKAEKWIEEEPYIETPPQSPPRERWLERDEADLLLQSAEAFHVKLALMICLYTAARVGAALELTWDRVNFRSGLIDLGHVDRGKRRAIVPIAAPLQSALIEAKSLATCDFVVEYRGDRVASIKTGVRAAVRRAGLDDVTPHVLRHTAATWMAMAGVPMKQISNVLGHSSERVTERIYAKHHPDYLKPAIKALVG